jgi:hypothetical protein
VEDYKKEYYDVAIKAIQNLKYYFGDLRGDCAAYLSYYFPNAKKSELLHAIDWALADSWGNGCEIETI